MQVIMNLNSAVRDILNSPGFIEDPDFDVSYSESLKYGTISKAQGHITLRKKVSKYFELFPCILNPLLLRNQKSIDNETLFYELQWKRLAHAFSANGKARLPNGKYLNLGAMNETFTWPMIVEAAESWIKEEVEPGNPEFCQWLRQSFHNALWHDNISDEKIENLYKKMCTLFDFALIVGSGWIWHSIFFIIYKDYLIYCNRGADCGEYPGVTIYRIDKSKITKEFLKTLANRLITPIKDHFSFLKIITELNGQPLEYIAKKSQKGPFCTYVSAKTVHLGLMIVYKMEAKIPEKKIEDIVSKNLNPSKKILLKQGLLQAKALHRSFINHDRMHLLKDFLIDLEESKEVCETLQEYAKQEGISAMANIVSSKVPKLKLRVRAAPEDDFFSRVNLQITKRLPIGFSALYNKKIEIVNFHNLKEFTCLLNLDLYGCDVSDKALEHLKQLAYLQTIYLLNCRITKMSHEKFQGFQNLSCVQLSNCHACL